MARICLDSLRLGSSVILLFTCATLLVAAPPQSAERLPTATFHYLSIPQAAKLKADWKRTRLSQVMQEPGMEAALKQATKRGIDNLELGIRWEDLENAGGEAAWAFIQPNTKQTGRVFLLEMSPKADATKKFLADLPQRLKKDGYTLSQQTIGTVEVQVAKKNAYERYFTLHGSYFIATSNLATMEAMLDVKQSKSLATTRSFQEVRARSLAQAKSSASTFIYSAPFELARARRLRGAVALAGRDVLELAERLKFDAIKAIGTTICIGSKSHELSYHLACYAPGPYRNAAQILQFAVGPEFTHPDWVPADLSACAMLAFDSTTGISAIKSLYDDFVKKAGSFDRFLKGMKNDPNGPQVDVMKDIVGNLTDRVTLITDTDSKQTPSTVRTVVAVELKNPIVVRQCLLRMFESDDRVRRHDFKKVVVWEVLAREKRKAEAIGFVCVAHDHLLFASDLPLIERLLPKTEAPLVKDSEFERVRVELKRLSPANVTMRAFTRPDQDFRVAYDALRAGKLADSKSIYGVLLSQFIGDSKNATLDPKKLPAFDRLVPHLGPAGMFLVPMKDGWVLNGFSLPRKP